MRLSLAAAVLVLAAAPVFPQAPPSRDPNEDIERSIRSTVDAVQAANERREAFAGARGLAALQTEDPAATEEFVKPLIGKLGENIAVRRFARFKVGDATATVAFTVAKPDEGEAAAPAK